MAGAFNNLRHIDSAIAAAIAAGEADSGVKKVLEDPEHKLRMEILVDAEDAALKGVVGCGTTSKALAAYVAEFGLEAAADIPSPVTAA